MQSHSDPSSVVTVVLVAGIILIVVGLNGVRFGRVTVGSFGVEGSDEKQAAQQFSDAIPAEALKEAVEGTKQVIEEASHTAEVTTPLSVEVQESDLIPTKDEIETIPLPGVGRLPVYPLVAIPLRVLISLFVEWPFRPEELPKDLSEFEFALRKMGKGNHPWIIKFKNIEQPIVVSLGGGGIRVRPLETEVTGTGS
jgi:hypothetical protein